MNGGKLIGTGSSSCVLNPGIVCKDNSLNKNRVSKLLYHTDAKELTEYEKKQSNTISKIKGHKDWSIIYNEFCEAPDYHKLKELDPEGIKNCFEGFWSFENNIPYKEAYILNSDYGGLTMKDIFKKMFSGENNINIIQERFIELMKMMHPLFLGLEVLNNNRIVHNDIKSINIVEHNGQFKYIDFGLAGLMSKIEHFKERSIKEYQTNRIYYYYPLEYIYFYGEKNDLLTLLNKIHKKKNFHIIQNLYKIMDLDINKEIYKIFNSIIEKKLKIQTVIKKIDVYGLGIQIPLLFYSETDIYYPHKLNSKIITDFYSLFGSMMDPDVSKRLTAKESYNQYINLMSQFHGFNKIKMLTPKVTAPKRSTRKRTPPKRSTRKRTAPKKI